MKKTLKNLLKFHKYDYEVWSNGQLLSEGLDKSRATLKFEFEYFLDGLALHNDTGDGYTFIVRRR